MGTNSIVFYCKDCGVMFFAVVNEPDSLDRNTRNDISKYLGRGHTLKTVPHDKVRQDFASVACCHECG